MAKMTDSPPDSMEMACMLNLETPADSRKDRPSLIGIPWSLIAYDIPEIPPWRARLSEQQQMETKLISMMIQEIAGFQEIWKQWETKVDLSAVRKVKIKMLESFIQHVNTEEEIGTSEKSATKRIVNRLANKENDPPLNQKRRRFSRSLSKSEVETENLYKAWKQLHELSIKEQCADPNTLGVLERIECITHIHKTLMTGVIDENKCTGPGIFSTGVRIATYKGKTHHYPLRETIKDWECCIDTVVDRYNSLLEGIKLKSEEDRIKELFKCAAWFLYTLVSEHPFSDGNGRLCRLLASYTLNTVTPFPTPIYNIYSDTKKKDYVDAIVKAREESGHPADMAALMIESNWCAWRDFLKKLNIPLNDSTKTA